MASSFELNALNSKSKITRENEFKRIARVMVSRWVVIFGLIIVFVFLLIAAFGPLIAPFDPYEQDLHGGALAQPSGSHLLGTDALGRDVLSRIIYGTRISLMVGVVAIAIAGVIGISLGLVAGYFGVWINNIIMRLMDALMAIPPIALSLAIAAFLGGGIRNIMLAIGIAMIPTYCRLMYGQVLTIKGSDYVLASRTIGVSDIRILMVHLFPNAFPPLLVLITLNIGTAILMEASLSFLGIGITPPEAAWGSMVNDGYRYLLTNPMLSVAPGIAVMLVVMAFNMVGDGLRDALDPRLRGTL
jgi:peptide/nickel transport system permease protein